MSFKFEARFNTVNREHLYFIPLGMQFYKNKDLYWNISIWILNFHIELSYYMKKWKKILEE